MQKWPNSTALGRHLLANSTIIDATILQLDGIGKPHVWVRNQGL